MPVSMLHKNVEDTLEMPASRSSAVLYIHDCHTKLHIIKLYLLIKLYL